MCVQLCVYSAQDHELKNRIIEGTSISVNTFSISFCIYTLHLCISTFKFFQIIETCILCEKFKRVCRTNEFTSRMYESLKHVLYIILFYNTTLYHCQLYHFLLAQGIIYALEGIISRT